MASAMWVDLICLGILAVFVLIGLFRGTLAGALRLGTLLLSYGAGYAGSKLLATPVGLALGVSDLIGAMAAGVVSFAACFMLLGLISGFIARADRRRIEEEGDGRSGIDRLGGALIGGLQGGVIVLLIGWLAIWVEAAQVLGVGPLADPAGTEPAAAPASPDSDRPQSMVASLTRDVIEEAASAALGDAPEAKIAAGLAARPAETIGGIQEVLESREVATLQNDELFWQYLSTGAIDSALNRGSFRAIAYDDELRGQLADLGLVNEAARNDPAVFRQSSQQAFAQIAPKLGQLRNDPAIQALASNPAVQQALSTGNHAALLMNPEIRSLINKYTQDIPTGN